MSAIRGKELTQGRGKRETEQMQHTGFRIPPSELQKLKAKGRKIGGHTILLRVIVRMYLAGKFKVTAKDIDTYR